MILQTLSYFFFFILEAMKWKEGNLLVTYDNESS